ncbi:hypothetical protein R6Q59_011464 [Mikania micrantha]
MVILSQIKEGRETEENEVCFLDPITWFHCREMKMVQIWNNQNESSRPPQDPITDQLEFELWIHKARTVAASLVLEFESRVSHH